MTSVRASTPDDAGRDVERCNACGGQFAPAKGIVPLLRCVDCGRQVPRGAFPPALRVRMTRPELLLYVAWPLLGAPLVGAALGLLGWWVFA